MAAGAWCSTSGDLAIGLEVGDSLAVNGVCLTAVEVGQPAAWRADVVAETLRRSNLGLAAAGDRVNLERPMRADGRFDGHIVQGHVDATGKVLGAWCPKAKERSSRSRRPPEGLRYVVEKGLDHRGWRQPHRNLGRRRMAFEVALIPHTISLTTLGCVKPGDLVNLEFDVLAKYVERLLEPQP